MDENGEPMARISARPQIAVAKNYEELCSQAAQKILALSKKRIREGGRFTLALSGGSTPEGIYSLMASRAYRKRFAWEKIHFFFGDERWVPRNSPRSNYKMIARALLTKVPVPRANIHAIRTNTPNAAASAVLYEKELIEFFQLKPGEFPCFDLILLGLGQDGHTASLFPKDPALLEKKRLAVPVAATGIAEKRVTLTLAAINHAKAVFFVASGREKALALKAVLSPTMTRPALPAQLVRPLHGGSWWFVDHDAAHTII